MCLSGLLAYMSVHHMYTWYLQRLEEGTGFPGTGVVDGYEATMWVLGIKPGSPPRTISTLYGWMSHLSSPLYVFE